MKLTTNQIEVIKLMREGWQMGHSAVMTRRTWLQKDGVGRGGESKDVNKNTFNSLVFKNLLNQDKYSFPTVTYKLTELGKTLKID